MEANKGLSLKESFLEGVLENSPVGIIKLIDGVVKLTNDKVCEICELTSDQLENRKLSDLLLNAEIDKYLQKDKKRKKLL